MCERRFFRFHVALFCQRLRLLACTWMDMPCVRVTSSYPTSHFLIISLVVLTSLSLIVLGGLDSMPLWGTFPAFTLVANVGHPCLGGSDR